MKTFISYRFTGEKIEDLKEFIFPVQAKLKELGIDAYCNLSDDDLGIRSKAFKPQDYVFDAFKTIDKSDFLFVLLNSEQKSEGMILEIGYCLGKGIPVVIAVKEGIRGTYLPGMARTIITWKDLDDLLDKLSQANFSEF